MNIIKLVPKGYTNITPKGFALTKPYKRLCSINNLKRPSISPLRTYKRDNTIAIKSLIQETTLGFTL